MAKHVGVDLFVLIEYPFQPYWLYQPHYPEIGIPVLPLIINVECLTN